MNCSACVVLCSLYIRQLHTYTRTRELQFLNMSVDLGFILCVFVIGLAFCVFFRFRIDFFVHRLLHFA